MVRKPIKATGTHLYKYGSNLAYLKEILLGNKVYFARHSQLNDPRELKPVLADLTKEEIIALLIELHPNPSEKDKMEIIYGLNKFGSEAVMEKLREILYFNEFDHRFGVYSLSKRMNNMALWAHYGNHHKGYCVEFQNAGLFSLAHDVIYEHELPVRKLSTPVDHEKIGREFLEDLFTKAVDWEYEEEVRIVLRPGYQIFTPDALTSVILGKDMPDEHIRQIADWVSQRQLPIVLKKARYNSANQQLEFVVDDLSVINSDDKICKQL